MRSVCSIRLLVLGLTAMTLLAGCRQAGPVTPQATPFAEQPAAPETVREPRTERREERESRSGSHAHGSGVPGQFDFYVLNLSWSPEFCYTHPDKPECAAHPRFVMHGLWPQNNDGSYGEDCSDAAGPANPQAYADLYPDQGLLAHEWATHGTCSGLAPDAFFSAARRAFRAVTIPPVLANDTRPIQLAPQEIITDFVQANPGLSADDMAVSCGNNYLTAVEVCLDKDLKPVSCQAVRSCRANVVKVVPPGQ